MVTWVLQSNIFNEQCFDDMVRHFERRSIPHCVVKMVPFSHEVIGPTPEPQGNIVVYGSIGVQELAIRKGWKPGVWTGTEQFNYSKYCERTGDLMLNADCVICPLSQARDIAAELDLDEFFMKPNADSKVFNGIVTTHEEFDS